MALVNGPLFSLGASGQVGKAIVYSKWKGRDYVREYVIPANPRTLAQIMQRGMLGALSRWWSSLANDSGAQASWNSLASSKNISPFNAEVSYNLDRETLDQAPVGNLDGGQTFGSLIDTLTASSPEPGRVLATATLVTAADGFELGVVAIGTAGGANTTAAHWNRVIAGDGLTAAQDEFTIDVSGLPPGAYYLSANIAGTDGTSGTWVPTASAVTVL